jgi:cytochrome bd-type quinol oxidase subunit 1
MPDAETLARIQFAFTVSFHIIFPTISIGLALYLAVFEGLWLKTKDAVYLQIHKFWLNIFAMAFGVGVVTGIVLSFEFGLGFAKFAKLAGPIIGPMIGLEVLTSFFLEAGFLGIMLLGLNRVGPRVHFFATCMVALGTVLSASWIMSANSWMQTPDGVVGERTARSQGLVARHRESVMACPGAAHAICRLSDREFSGSGCGCVVSPEKGAHGFCAADGLAWAGHWLGPDRWASFHW